VTGQQRERDFSGRAEYNAAPQFALAKNPTGRSHVKIRFVLVAAALLMSATPMVAQDTLSDRLQELQRQGMDRYFAMKDQGPLTQEAWGEIAEADWKSLQVFIEAAEAEPDALADDELHALFIATIIAAEVAAALPEDAARADRVTAALERSLLALDRRGAAGPEEFGMAHAMAFGLGVWSREARLRTRAWDAGQAPIIEAPPNGVEGRQLWRLDPATRRVEDAASPSLESVDWVVVAFPGCGPALRLLEATASDEVLQALFRGRSLWLALPPQGALDFERAFERNGLGAGIALHFMRRQSDWPFLTFPTASPTFYRLRDGEVVGSYLGWGDDGQAKARLVELDAMARASEP
jgi:hypothetical protein